MEFAPGVPGDTDGLCSKALPPLRYFLEIWSTSELTCENAVSSQTVFLSPRPPPFTPSLEAGLNLAAVLNPSLSRLLG